MRFIVTILFFTFLLSACSKSVETFKEVIRPIAWMDVQPSSYDQVRRLSGTVHPVESTTLSFEVGGKVEWVKAKLGDEIRRGDPLARLNQRNFDLSLNSSQANFQKAQAGLSEAKNEFVRYTELSKKGLVSKSGYDNVKAAFESASSAVKLAKAQLDISSKDLSDTLLTAPYNGKITKRLIEPSMQVSPGQTTFEIEGEDGLEVQVMIPETLIRQVSKGSEVSIHYPAFPEIINSGTITEIGSQAVSANAFPVTILINTLLSDLRAGMTAEVNFTFKGVGRSGNTGVTFRLPISSLGAGEGQSAYVFVYDTETQSLHKQIVQTESIINNEVFVSSGLKAGDIIAIAGISFLRDGQTVRLLDKHIQQFN